MAQMEERHHKASKGEKLYLCLPWGLEEWENTDKQAVIQLQKAAEAQQHEPSDIVTSPSPQTTRLKLSTSI